jgi:hypothetical protein
MSRIAAGVFGATRCAEARVLSMRELRADLDDSGIEIGCGPAPHGAPQPGERCRVRH